jgi:hypothetical protein
MKLQDARPRVVLFIGVAVESQLVEIVTAENPYVDTVVKATMPWFVRPLVQPLFARHRV